MQQSIRQSSGSKNSSKSVFGKQLPYILLVTAVVGLICSFVLTYDSLQLARNPHYQPACNINPIISCGDVAQSAQGTVIGSIPNPWLGLIAFSVPLTISIALLAGATFRRWFWRGLQAGVTFGAIAVHWFFFQSVYNLQALCPYCMAVWLTTIIMFWYVTLYNLEAGYVVVSRHAQQKIMVFLQRHHLDILIAWLLVIAALILQHFWYYYGHLSLL
mgnify:CR=1 FL=1